LQRLSTITHKGLRDTAQFWPPIRRIYAWVHAVAHILENSEQLAGDAVRRKLTGLLAAMQRWAPLAGELQSAVAHFIQVARSYWPGLFHCYDVADLPRTNNELEQFFGRYRHLERRITGRKKTNRALVLRGQTRLTAALSTQQRAFSGQELAPNDLMSWRTLRALIESRCEQQRRQRRFRRDPDTYLANLEQQLNKLTLPP
jgi:hypothetical protein